MGIAGGVAVGEWRGIAFTDATATTKYGGMQFLNDAASDSSIRFLTWDGTAGGTERMVIKGVGGNVGIGTVPQSRLHIAGGLLELNAQGANGSFSIPDTCGGTWATGVTSGIFAREPAVGCGDEWYIASYPRTAGGENRTLEIGIKDNADDHIALMPSGNVGIGTVNPANAHLQINGPNPSSGTTPLFAAIKGGGGAADYVLFARDSAGAGQVGININNPSANFQVNGTTLLSSTLNTTGNVYINLAAAGMATLDVNGTARIRTLTPSIDPVNYPSNYAVVADVNGYLHRLTATLVNPVSSRRYKTNIRNLDTDYNVLKLQPVRFQWKTNGQEDIGLIAEDVDQAVKDLVIYKDGQPESVKYDKVAVCLLGIVKDQQKKLESLEKEIAELRAKIK
jgi:hypothetical protein